MIKDFLKKKISDFKPIAYAVSKLQLLVIASLLLLLLKPFFPVFSLNLIVTFFSLYYLYVLITEIKAEVRKEEYLHYFVFFFLLLAVVDLAAVLPFFLGELSAYAFFVPLIILLSLFAVSFILRRKFTYCMVSATGKGDVVIEKDFDLLSLTTAGKFVVKADKPIKKGTVKAAVKTTFSGRKPYKILYDN